MEKQSIQELSWASCREPYKSELDRLASLWIDGLLSNEKLALRAVQMLSELDWIGQPDEDSQKIPVDDVVSQLKILTEAMLVRCDDPDCTPELRRQALEFMQTEPANRDRKSRPTQ